MITRCISRGSLVEADVVHMQMGLCGRRVGVVDLRFVLLFVLVFVAAIVFPRRR